MVTIYIYILMLIVNTLHQNSDIFCLNCVLSVTGYIQDESLFSFCGAGIYDRILYEYYLSVLFQRLTDEVACSTNIVPSTYINDFSDFNVYVFLLWL